MGLLTYSLFADVSSQALFVSAHSTHHMLALPLTHASTSGARLQLQSIVSRSSTQASRSFSRVTLTSDRSFTAGGCSSSAYRARDPAVSFHAVSEKSKSPYSPLKCRSGHILLTPTLPGNVTVHSGWRCCSLVPVCCPLLSSDHMLCSCRLDVAQASLPPNSAHSPSLPRVRDWSTVVVSCHHGIFKDVRFLPHNEFWPFWGAPSPVTFHNARNHGGGQEGEPGGIAREQRTKENKANNTKRKTKTNRNKTTKKDTGERDKQHSPCFFFFGENVAGWPATFSQKHGLCPFRCLGCLGCLGLMVSCLGCSGCSGCRVNDIGKVKRVTGEGAQN